MSRFYVWSLQECVVLTVVVFYQPYGVNQAGATIKYAATRTDRSTQESSGGCTREHCAVGILATFSRFSCVNVWVRFYAGFVWSLK